MCFKSSRLKRELREKKWKIQLEQAELMETSDSRLQIKMFYEWIVCYKFYVLAIQEAHCYRSPQVMTKQGQKERRTLVRMIMIQD